MRRKRRLLYTKLGDQESISLNGFRSDDGNEPHDYEIMYIEMQLELAIIRDDVHHEINNMNATVRELTEAMAESNRRGRGWMIAFLVLLAAVVVKKVFIE
ncbi:hypothetical protein L2E82_16609 [Cichorium intybus]|uniref:Uncharacterized protein n=1 Tax=Cichorium intybus TaxID=13427 RepID=A0ACB9F621_CICIN|nr:hypothetical protein L2E82_16609 [Cichorium intybus]